jgi:hypothetical protein
LINARQANLGDGRRRQVSLPENDRPPFSNLQVRGTSQTENRPFGDFAVAIFRHPHHAAGLYFPIVRFFPRDICF